ncbi:hypothetical protein EVAR_39383_1 [Eumeta japonica]|uniref:Uncharacterized protein n=1 Tax=Eumeta variegata TaxID=151549 RepID=A0A4C1ZEF3_EUMVA|nr:hypothetical protein EVAR_39383_1 [Eumeta japonica]
MIEDRRDHSENGHDIHTDVVKIFESNFVSVPSAIRISADEASGYAARTPYNLSMLHRFKNPHDRNKRRRATCRQHVAERPALTQGARRRRPTAAHVLGHPRRVERGARAGRPGGRASAAARFYHSLMSSRYSIAAFALGGDNRLLVYFHFAECRREMAIVK